MNKEVNLDIKVFKELIESFKDFLIPVFIIFSCVLLFFIIILPQITTLLDNQKLQKQESEKLKVLSLNLSTLSAMDEAKLDREVLKVSKTLPPEKDFAAIVNSLSNAASSARVSIGDFQIQVGDLTQIGAGSGGAIPNMQITLNVQADVNSLSTFLTTLSSLNPVSTVDSVKSGSGSSIVTLSFYYRPLPQISFNDTSAIVPLNTKTQNDVDNLPEPVVDVVNLPIASQSSGIRSPF